jgi:hypothetical protein
LIGGHVALRLSHTLPTVASGFVLIFAITRIAGV